MSEVRQRFWPVAVFSVSVVIFISMLLAYTLWLDYSSRISDSKNNARFIANLVASQTRSTIAELEKMLDGIVFELSSHRLRVEPSLNEETGRYLKGIGSTYKNLMDVLVLDAKGAIIQWTGEGKPPIVTDRAYARAHIDHDQSELFIGEPLLSKVHKGQWFFGISKAQRDETGRLEYIVVAIVDIRYFRSRFADIELPEDSSLVLIRKSGRLITRSPDHEKYIGTHVDEAAEIWKLGNLEGSREVESPVDHVDRIIGFRLLEEYGIGAYSTISREVVLEGWYRLVYIAAAILAFVVVVLVLFSGDIYLVQKRVADQQRKLANLARTDELTGLFNRRYVRKLLQAEFRRAKRYGLPLSILMLDIDHFKSVNDKYGHNCGDAVIVRVAEIMRNVSRDEAVIGRYGGEEFLVILPSTTKAESIAVAERFREAVENERIDCGQVSIAVTISVGVASSGHEMEQDFPYSAVKKADQALYKAKDEGRNRVVVA